MNGMGELVGATEIGFPDIHGLCFRGGGHEWIPKDQRGVCVSFFIRDFELLFIHFTHT